MTWGTLPAFPCQPSILFPGLPLRIGAVATLSPAAKRDLPFLKRLYRDTREDELAVTGWPDAAKQVFCDSQFDLQHAHYVGHHPQGDFLLVMTAGDAPIGRLYADGSGDGVHLIDISLLSVWRDRGLGSAILQALQRRSAALGKAVTLQVHIQNARAIAFYRGLGFIQDGVSGTHMAMRWAS